jgi:hypothetical protein
MMNRTVVVLGCTTLLAAAASAQDTRNLRDRTVPLELVEALLSTPRSALPPAITIGEVPPPMKGSVFVPPDARILGGSFNSSGATVVLQAGTDPNALERLLRAENSKLGWKDLQLPGAGGSGGGFRDPAGPTNGIMCRSGTALTVTVTLIRAGESRVRMSSDADGICSMMDRAATMSASAMDPMSFRWPLLVNPVVSRGMQACPMVQSFGGMQTADLMTPMPLPELIAHYSRQLTDSGWTRANGEASMQAFTRQDSTTGTKLLLRIVAETYDGYPSCRRVSLQTGIAR